MGTVRSLSLRCLVALRGKSLSLSGGESCQNPVLEVGSGMSKIISFL